MNKYFWNPLIVIFIIDLFAILILITINGFHIDFKVLTFFILFEILRFYFPFFMLFLNYKFHDHKFKINISSKEFTIIKKKTKIKFENINKIEKFVSLSKYSGRRTLMWDQFHYYKLKTHEGEEIFISCLVCDKLGMYFHKDVFTQKPVFLPFYEKN